MSKYENKIQNFFFFFLLSFFVTPFSLIIAVQGRVYTPTIRADWLYATAGTFQDNSPNSWETNIKTSVGGGDMWDFQNLGIVSANDNEVLYKARATFGFEVTVHTNVGFRDIYPNININSQHTEPFFSITRYYFGYDKTSTHSVSWNSIELGTFREHNYDGSIPITVGIRDIPGNDGTITIGETTFDTPAYIADIVRTRVTNVRDGEVGAYTDQFTNVADVTEGTVTFQELDDDFSASESKVIAFYQNSNLGWTAGAIQRGQTIQQLMVGASQIGSNFPNPASSDSYTFLLNTQLQPEVYEFVQYNKIRYATIGYVTWGLIAGRLETYVGPATKTAPKRIVAVHTTNSFIHWDFEVTVEFYATVESTAELTQAILNDPRLRAGDIMWDVSFTGDYKVDVPLQKETIWDILDNLFGGLFGGLQNILLLIAVIVVAIVIIYIALKFRKRKSGQMIQIRTGGKVVK